MSYTPLPIGIDDFKKLRTSGYYYVDKTWLIKELLEKKGEVNLFTRPRRFGKTLNISMLKYYFEIPEDGKSNRKLFDGLRIMETGDEYTKMQEQYPVITLTLKSAKQPDWEMAYASMIDDIAREYKRHNYVLSSENIIEDDKNRYRAIQGGHGTRIDYAKSLLFLSECMYEYYKKKVIILIDEYDVPLENAYYAGFYDKMIAFIRSLFESALKTNPYLEFSVITGCLRVSRESIFTGLNNLKIISILSEEYGEHFGFTEKEVQDILNFYHREDKIDTLRQWYDGYRFGDTEVYNPWSVINYTEKIYGNRDAFPVSAWSNSSSNSIVKDLIEKADSSVRAEIENLLNGESIEKPVHEDITYADIYKSEVNLWNFLFFTGYLKQVDKRMIGDDIYLQLKIPNREVAGIYRNTIINWFCEEVKIQDLSCLYDAMLNGKSDIFEMELTKQLQRTISYMDSKEDFYHGFLLGILANLKEYIVKSNREAGDGRYDICVCHLDERIPPIILELKVSKTFKNMYAKAIEALEQIEEKHYDMDLAEDGYSQTICYGISFFKKKCKVVMKKRTLR